MNRANARHWADVIADMKSPYEFRLGLQVGAKFAARPPYPDLDVIGVEEVYVRRILLQQLVVSTSVPEDGGAVEHLEVQRLVAELEGGAEVEISRAARPLERQEIPVDKTTCAACRKAIPHGEAVEHKGAAYHRGRCIDVDEPLSVDNEEPADDIRGHVPRRKLEEDQ